MQDRWLDYVKSQNVDPGSKVPLLERYLKL